MHVRSAMDNKVLFLERDGVVDIDKNYVHRIEVVCGNSIVIPSSRFCGRICRSTIRKPERLSGSGML
jgi:hypothetical protein